MLRGEERNLKWPDVGVREASRRKGLVVSCCSFTITNTAVETPEQCCQAGTWAEMFI